MIDLGRIDGVDVDHGGGWSARAAAALLRDVDRGCRRTACASRPGSSRTPARAASTLGGGVGWLTRKFGLTCDNVAPARVVLPSGQIVAASTIEHSDLDWGLRGGGGNFGVVTEFEYRAHPFPRRSRSASPSGR